jgi:hypothetical protein
MTRIKNVLLLNLITGNDNNPAKKTAKGKIRQLPRRRWSLTRIVPLLFVTVPTVPTERKCL